MISKGSLPVSASSGGVHSTMMFIPLSTSKSTPSASILGRIDLRTPRDQLAAIPIVVRRAGAHVLYCENGDCELLMVLTGDRGQHAGVAAQPSGKCFIC